MSQALNFFVSSSSRSPATFTISRPSVFPSTGSLRLPVKKSLRTLVVKASSSAASDLDESQSSPVLVSENGLGGLLSSATQEYGRNAAPGTDSSSIEVDTVTEAELKENGFRSTRRTKLICTIGPASCGFEQLEALAEGGMNVARINMCHGTREWHRMVIERLRRLNEEKGFAVAIMMDTEGSEIHMGDLGGASSAKAEVTTPSIPIYVMYFPF